MSSVPSVPACFICEKLIIESMDSVCLCVFPVRMCMCVFVPFKFGQQDRDKAVAKLDRSQLKKCSVCAGLFGCHLPGDALGTGTLTRPHLAGCCMDQWVFLHLIPVFLQVQSLDLGVK